MGDNNTHVVIGAEHPVFGYMYLDCIQDSTVGYVNIYEVTDRVYLCATRNVGWRDCKFYNPYDQRKLEEQVISDHLNNIDWYENNNIKNLCCTHRIQIRELREWCLNLANWKDIPVIARKSESGSWYEAVSLIVA
ncbi:hypothetical protein BIY27_12205 [Gibbsiella quercinecans]|uniref:hypothetical protein n=1 Tax=Gibbsiella quercinecans TaxID=929813 RepID=UPI000EF1A60D|nr:hypothetical protein [Gibbsiella quercinecans]RLM11794.1 hypothetical protein BIY27_12205 [Gibbsiella quercinecans]